MTKQFTSIPSTAAVAFHASEVQALSGIVGPGFGNLLLSKTSPCCSTLEKTGRYAGVLGLGGALHYRQSDCHGEGNAS